MNEGEAAFERPRFIALRRFWFQSRGWRGRARIASGLVLFVYVAGHFTGHAMGLVSLEAQHATGQTTSLVWRSWPGTVALYGALGVHAVLGLVALVDRSTWRMGWREAFQIVTGLALPLLLATHVIGTRWAQYQYDLNASYEYVLAATFAFSPNQAWLNATALVVAWAHGVNGLHHWLRFKAFWSAGWTQAGLAIAVAVPILALTGYLAAGREIAPLVGDGEWLGGYYERLRVTSDDVFRSIGATASWVRVTVLGLIVGALAVRLGLWINARVRDRVTVDYVDGPRVLATAGPTLLEISRINAVPHASACGGRGRCSTCRVLVQDARPRPDDAAPAERRLLQAVRAPDAVRLACQWSPRGTVKVMRLLPPDATLADARAVGAGRSGEERRVAILFADLRAFTAHSERRLPFDVVYLINQFSRAAGHAIEAEGGRVDKFLGDGVMAVFGMNETDPGEASRRALRATVAILAAVDELSERLEAELSGPLRLAVGLHLGPAIVGEMGWGDARGLTVIGDAVNTASRLEALAKSDDAVLVASRAVVEAALGPTELDWRKVVVRGREQKLEVATFMNQRDIPDANVPVSADFAPSRIPA